MVRGFTGEEDCEQSGRPERKMRKAVKTKIETLFFTMNPRNQE
jgi:hypothetical protein